jgi:hypothetical protein
MRQSYLFGGFFFLLLSSFGCSGGAGFSTSEKINGRDPSPATFPIFGQSTTVEDGVPFAAVALMVSNHPDLCSELEKNKNWPEMLAKEPNDSTIVANVFIREGDLPKSGETFSDEILVSIFFAFHDDKPVTVAFNDGTGTISFDKVSDTALSGRLSTNLIYEVVKDQDIDVQLVGSFQRASHCKALDDVFDDEALRQQMLDIVHSQHSAL